MLSCMASTSILLAGFIVGTYFVQLRGPGWAAWLASGRLPELVLVGGALTALAVVVHLSVLRALAASVGPTSVRGQLRRALDLLGNGDGASSDAYAALPQEVRELVTLFETQRHREQQLEREKQCLREEMQNLVQALERCAATFEPLPASGSGEFTARVAQVWNQAVSQARRVPAIATAVEPPVPSMLPAAFAVASAASEYPAWAGGDTVANAEPASAVSQRLQELESRLAALQHEMQALHAPAPAATAALLAAPAATAAPLVAPAAPFAAPERFAAEAGDAEPEPEWSPKGREFQVETGSAPNREILNPLETTAIEPAGAHAAHGVADSEAPLQLLPDPMFLEPEVELEDDASMAASTWTDVVPTAMPWVPAGPSATFDLSLPEPEGMPALGAGREIVAVPEPAPTPEEQLRDSRSEVQQPTQPAKAGDSGYFEWTGASTQRGSWKLLDAANEELAGETVTRTSAAPLAPRTASMAPSAPLPAVAPATNSGRAPLATPVPPNSQSFETYFPHFVGKPVGELEGRVAVSFEGGSSLGGAARRPEVPGLDAGSVPSGRDSVRRPWRPTEYDT